MFGPMIFSGRLQQRRARSAIVPLTCGYRGVSDGGRTRDNRDHNPVLYQLSYTHHVQAAVYGRAARAANPFAHVT
jgi:hypothetical protein